MRSEAKVAIICGFVVLLTVVGWYAWSGPTGKGDRTGGASSGNSLVKNDQPAGDAGPKVQPPANPFAPRSSFADTPAPSLTSQPSSTDELRGEVRPPAATGPAPLVEDRPLMPPVSTRPAGPTTRRSEPLPPSGPTTDYVVKQGDTIWSVAKQFKVTRAALASANNISPDAHLKLKQVLKIPASAAGVSTATRPAPTTRPGNGGHETTTRPAAPGTATAGTYKVKAGDTLRKIAKAVYGDESKWSQIYNANKAAIGSNPNDISADMVLKIPH